MNKLIIDYRFIFDGTNVRLLLVKLGNKSWCMVQDIKGKVKYTKGGIMALITSHKPGMMCKVGQMLGKIQERVVG